MNDLAKQKILILSGCVLFLSGACIGLAMRPDIPSLSPVMRSYAELQTQMEMLSAECARPQTGVVTVTGKDLIDVVRKKSVSFTVETTIGKD